MASWKVFAFFVVACLAMVKAQDKVNDEVIELPNDESKVVMEDLDAEKSMVALNDYDPDSTKHKGFCHSAVGVWHKPGVSIRCNCMKCTCQNGGNWACGFFFGYCPYYYCGNVLYNPGPQLCCCGKVHTKQRNYACCGYFYYDTRTSQCCNYYSVKSKKAKCPRDKI